VASTTFAPDGTPLYTFPGGVALAQGEDTLARGATCVLRTAPAGALVPMYDLQLRPITSVRTSETLGTFPAFYGAAAVGVLDAGSVQLPINSIEALAAGLAAEARTLNLQRLLDALQASVADLVTHEQLDARLSGLGGGGGGGGDLVVTDFMRLVLQESAGSGVRSRIGAGTSSLALGTSSSTAKAGDWKPALSDLSDAGAAGREVARQDTTSGVHTALGLVELIQDTLATTLVAGSGATLAYDDANGRLTLTVAGGAGGTGTTDPEIVRDVIGAALVAGGGVQVLVNDAADSITITALLRTVAGKAPGSDGNVALAAGDIASGTFALARATPGSTVTVDYVRSDGYAGANAWPTARPSSRADVYFRLTGPRSAFPTDTTAAPYSWMLDGDEPAYEDA
jgi:hypothetical protein